MALDWPDGFDRTPEGKREAYPHGFRVTRSEAFDSILEELRRIDATNIKVETDAPHTKANAHRPYSDRDPDDPGVVVFFERDGRQFAVPCDRWDNLRDNARAVAKYLESKRALDRYGVQTVESEFSTQTLPSGEEDEAIVADDGRRMEPHEVLQVSPDAGAAAVRGAYRELLKERHPDHGGSQKEFERLQQARDAMVEGGS